MKWVSSSLFYLWRSVMKSCFRPQEKMRASFYPVLSEYLSISHNFHVIAQEKSWTAEMGVLQIKFEVYWQNL